jgi:3-isopropylmalate dehydrogenase
MSHLVAVLPGDGIGPEVIQEATAILSALRPDIELKSALVGGAAIDEAGEPLPASTLDLCREATAVLLGAVGGPKWDKLEPVSRRPEVGALLPLRRELNLYANIRPAQTMTALLHASPLKEERSRCDLIVVRELTGGIYFGTPRERQNGGDTAIDTCIYHRHEVERIARRAFEIAANRRQYLVSVDKANVLETSRLWREVVEEVSKDYPQVSLAHMLVDNCAMQLIRDPGQFDVILTENMFGDILSDEASMITGSLGLLPSASLSDAKGGNVFGLYEPVHGSAPDIAGQDKANPLAAILSVAMMLELSFADLASAKKIRDAVEEVLTEGYRTGDIYEEGSRLVGTREMGRLILGKLEG